MNINDLRMSLSLLIDRYVTDVAAKARLNSLVARPQVPAKGILAELEPFLIGSISQTDADIVKEIAFHFC